MNERIICCCGAGGWTKFIGWFELVMSVIFTIFLGGLAIVGIKEHVLSDSGEIDENALIIVALLIVIAVFLFLGIVFAVVLLKGSYNRNPSYIRAWMIYTCVFLVLTVLAGAVKCFKAVTVSDLVGDLIEILLTCAVYGFFLWVVGIHKKEVEATVRYPVRI